MKIKVITSYKPGCWEQYGKKGIEAMAEHLPKEIDLVVYAEEPKPNCNYERIQWIDLNNAEPELVKFKTRHKNDPVANGETKEIAGGVRRLKNAGKNDKGKGSFLWDAVRFSHKTFCVAHAIKTIDADMILWLDADTYTFADIPESFIRSTLPANKLTCYLGRGGMYPECGWVGYNKKHTKLEHIFSYILSKI